MDLKMKFLKKYFQSLRLQRTSVAHSVRKNEKALRSYRIFLIKSSNLLRNYILIIPFPVLNGHLHSCKLHYNWNEIFTKRNYYFQCDNIQQKIIIPYKGINQPDD